MRTDLTRACPECRTRTFPQERCPKCDTALVDLRDTEEQTRVLQTAWLRDTAQMNQALPALIHTRFWIEVVKFAFIGVIGAIALGVSGLSMKVLPFFILMPPLLYVRLRYGKPAVARRLNQDYRNPAEPNLRLALSPVTDVDARKALPASARLVVRGKVHMRAPHRSPLGNDVCVGFRLVGTCGAFFVDDAGGTSFDVLVEGSDDRIAVELDHALLELPTPKPRKLRDDEPRPHLDAFLSSRGIALGRLRLSEALLRDGDTVEVTGPSEVLAEPGTYRESTYVRTFRGTPDDPVRIAVVEGA